jgi:TonB family protein
LAEVGIQANLQEIRLVLNGTLVGVYEIDRFAGYIIIQPKKGRVQMRSIEIGEIASRSGLQDLDQSAIATVRRWKFRPGTINGSPVAVVVEVEMTFAIGR